MSNEPKGITGGRAVWAILRRSVKPTPTSMGVVLTSVGAAVLDFLGPQMAREAINSIASGEGAVNQGARFAALFVGAAVGGQLLRAATQVMARYVGHIASNRVRDRAFRKVLARDLDDLQRTEPGELISRVDGDVQHLDVLFSVLLPRALTNLVLAIGVIGMMTFTSVPLGALFAAMGIGGMLLLVRMNGPITTRWTGVLANQAALIGTLEQQVAAREDLAGNAGYGFARNKLLQASQSLLRATVPALATASFATGFVVVMQTVTTALALGFTLYFVDAGSRLGVLYQVFAYSQLLLRPVTELSADADYFRQAQAGAIRLWQLLSEPQLERPHTEQRLAETGPLAVAASGLGFDYDTRDGVLRDVSFDFTPGSRVCVRGTTGAGKSTLLRLLVGLIRPTRGEVLLDGQNPFDLRSAEVESRVAYVVQRPIIFEATLRDNVTFFDPRISDAEVSEALEIVGLKPLAKRFALDSYLSSDNISAGEQQLIGLARALVRRPGVVLLDEPTALLDQSTERLVLDAISRVFRLATIVFITHGETVRDLCDAEFMLVNGQLVDSAVAESSTVVRAGATTPTEVER